MVSPSLPHCYGILFHSHSLIPAKAGIQKRRRRGIFALGPRFRGDERRGLQPYSRGASGPRHTKNLMVRSFAEQGASNNGTAYANATLD